jgi:hypothetical protein
MSEQPDGPMIVMTDPQPIPDFPGFIASLTADQGYSLNLCRDCCPDKGGAEHAHLRTPDKDDMIVWADGNWIMYDLTLPARSIYCPVPERGARWRP